jgi:hypothetical protein
MLSKIRRFCSLNVTVGVGQQRPINTQQFITMLIKLSLVRLISHFELHRLPTVTSRTHALALTLIRGLLPAAAARTHKSESESRSMPPKPHRQSRCSDCGTPRRCQQTYMARPGGMMAVTVYGWAAALMPGAGAGESRRNSGLALPGSLTLWLRAALPGRAATGRPGRRNDALPGRAGAIYQSRRNLLDFDSS